MILRTFVCFSLAVLASSQLMSDTQNVLTEVMKDYDKRVRPAVDQSQPVFINVSFSLVAVQEFDEVSEKLSIVGVLNLVWYDNRIRWDPFAHNKTWTVNIPMSEVWTPHLVLTNPINKIKVIGADWIEMKFVYTGVGYVSVGDVIHSKCNVDVTYFPFDTQICDLMFIPWGNQAHEVYMVSELDHALTDYFSENGEWMLEGTAASSGYVEVGEFSFINFQIRIRRRPTFFLVNVVLPIIFMGFLNVLVFILPVQSGERVSYAITVLLAIAVFLTLVGDNMPKTSEPMSTLCYFLIVNLIESAVICLATIFNLMLYYREESNPPSQGIAGVTRMLLCKRRKNDVTKIKVLPKQVSNIKVLSKAEDTMNPGNPDIKVPENNFINWMNDGIPTENYITWKDVSSAADRVLGLLSLVWLIVTSITFMVMIATQTQMMSSG